MLGRNVNHVALFIPDMGSGGAERITANLANGLVDRGINCDLVLVNAEGYFLKILDSRVRVVDLGSGRVMKSIVPLAEYLRHARPDVLISALDHANVAAILATRFSMTGSKVVVAVHTTRSQSERYAQNTWKAVILKKTIRLLYPFADAIVTVSKGAALDLSKTIGIDAADIFMIYNPIIDDSIFKMAQSAPSHPWFVDNRFKIILAIGSLIKTKNFQSLIHAFSVIKEKFPDSKLVILGEGEERPTLDTLVNKLMLKNDVSMPGFVPNPYSYLARASLFVLSSLWEALPTVLIEALALGVPLLSTDCPSGPREILDSGRYGKLIPVGDNEALAAAIFESLAAGRRKGPEKEAWAPFTVKAGVDRYISMMNTICDEKSRVGREG